MITLSDQLEKPEFEELFREYAPGLARFLAQIVSSRALADDLLQETFLAAWKDRGRLARDVTDPKAWLFGIARNRALNALRTHRRAVRAVTRLAHERPAATPDPAEAVAVRDFLIKSLRPEDRILLILRYVHGFDSNELSVIVGKSSEAVRQQLSRARRQLLAQLADTPPAHSRTEGQHEPT
jgi:RNA polymerase sigma-70 factor (ECF subfamily)